MFNKIIGNDDIKKILLQSVKLNKISHSYLFVGTEGIGKKLIAEEFAKMILCIDENKYCNHCKSCIEFDTNNNPDFKIIEPDGNSLKIEQIREFQSKVFEKPIISNRKVYLINDSNKMTVDAQNCLLKTLEEPPEFVTIILIGSNDSAFLSTIKSRCMILRFNNLSNNEIGKYLANNLHAEIQSQAMLDAFQGSIGKAIKLIDRQEEYDKVENIINNIEKRDVVDILNMADVLYKSKEEKYELLDYINIILIKLARINSKYAPCISVVENTKKRLQSNANYDMSIDNMLLKLWEEIN